MVRNTPTGPSGKRLNQPHGAPQEGSTIAQTIGYGPSVAAGRGTPQLKIADVFLSSFQQLEHVGALQECFGIMS